MQRIVLAYSGGLTASIAIPWLAETYGAEIVAVTLDLGQSQPVDGVRERALAAGATAAHVVDARQEFVHDYVLPALHAGALCEGRRPLAAALSRPLIARKLVEIARLEAADAIAHGCPGQGTDRARLEKAARALEPAIQVLAPAAVSGMTRGQKLDYAAAHGVAAAVSRKSPYSTDENLWGRTIECGDHEDPWREPPEDAFTITRSGGGCPAVPAYVEIAFEKGVPTSVNGVDMPTAELIHSVATIAGAQGVGRIDVVESGTPGGAASREIHEAPAAVVLHAAHRELEGIVVPKELSRLKRELGVKYAELVDDGLWFTPTREAIDAFAATVQPRVTGEVRLRLWRGECRVVGRRLPGGAGEAPMPLCPVLEHTDRVA